MNRCKKEVMKWSENADGTIILKAEDQPKLSISQIEWGAANMRFIFNLLQEWDPKRTQTEDYMCFTLMIHELASIDWQSALEDDICYRSNKGSMSLDGEHHAPT